MRSLSLRSLSPLLALTIAAASHAQTAVSSSFNLSVFADADRNDGVSATDAFADSQGATLNPYSHFLSVTDTVGNDSVAVFTSGNASWVDAGHGSVFVVETGWSFDTSTSSQARTNTNFSGQDVWTYTFVATPDGTFTMDYSVSGSGDTFGLQGIVIHWDGPGGDLNLADAFDPTTSGSFVRSLTSGVMYTVGVGSYSNLSADAGTSASGNLNAGLNWKIESVPEPATLGVLAVGLIPLLRRRR